MRSFDDMNSDVAVATGKADVEWLQRLSKELSESDDPRAEATINSVDGTVFSYQGDNEKAMECYSKSLDLFHELGQKRGEAQALGNMGTISGSTGDYDAATSYFKRSMAMHEELDDSNGVAIALTNIGLTQKLNSEFADSLESLRRAQMIFEENGNTTGLMNTLSTLGQVYSEMGQLPEAIALYRQALSQYEKAENKHGAATVLSNIAQIYELMGERDNSVEYFQRAQSLFEEIKEPHGVAAIDSNLGIAFFADGEYEQALAKFDNALAIFEKLNDVDSIALVMGSIASTKLSMGNVEEASVMLDKQSEMVYTDLRVKIEHLANRATRAELSGDLEESDQLLGQALALSKESGRKPIEVQLYERRRDLALKREDLPSYVEYNNEFVRLSEEMSGKKAAQKIALMESEQKIATLKHEREKEKALLYGALPESVANRMLKGEDVSGDHFDHASVMFADVVGFTDKSQGLEPRDVTELLDTVFNRFDELCEEYNVTKIKTIGDAYLAVGFEEDELSSEQRTSSVAAAIQELGLTWPDGSPLQFRIGLHAGPVVAGVIGKQRLQYDVWGDTVNVASRMESSGEAGRVHLSETFASAIPVAQKRGSLEIKGKGSMTTYWL